MRKLFTATAVALLALGSLQAKELQDIRIYINPGHGGWGSGDRHMGTVGHGEPDYTDTCGFFETNTNMWKGLALLQRLADYGFKYDPTLNQRPEGAPDELYRWGAARDMSQGLVMSHVKNGVSRNINEIATEVEMNNFDYFISVHSNAHVDGNNTNYPAMFVRGENGTQSVPGSVEVARVIWPYAYSNTHSCWSNYSMTNMGLYYDIDFWSGDYVTVTHPNGQTYKGYYAVLRHGVPGMLCEGYFHTYQPARHRALNPDVCAIEGEAYARGIAEYFGVPRENTGDIYGIVRDLHERFRHKYYNAPASSPDAFMPLNGATAILFDADGNEVARRTTDNETNGAFVFRHLAPGIYTVKVECEGYKEMSGEYAGPFTVEAAKTVYPKFWLENEAYEPPAVEYTDYPDEADTPAYLPGTEYTFATAYEGAEIEPLQGKTVKRMIVRGDKVYILAHDRQMQPTLVVVNAANGQLLSRVSTAGTKGNLSPLGDIAITADGILVGTSAQHCVLTDDELAPGEVKGYCQAYKWENGADGLPAGDPVLWFQTGATANFYSAYTGFTFAYTGTSQEGAFYLPSYSTYYNRKVWLNRIDILEGEYSSSSFINDTRDHMNMDELGEDVTISVSPLSSGSFVVNSANVPAMQFNGTSYDLERTWPDCTPRAGYFMYAGHAMCAHSDLDEAGAHCGTLIHDLHADAPVSAVNGAMEAHPAVSASAGRTVVTRNQDERITAVDMDLFALRGSALTRLTTAGTTQPAVRGNYAYNFHLTQDTDGDRLYRIGFSLTDEAEASVVLVAAEGNAAGEPSVVVAHDTFPKGFNMVEVDPANLTGDYNVTVTVHNPAVPAVGRVFDSGIVSSGVAIDLNPESAFFGNVYVAQKSGDRGIRAFTADLAPMNDTPWLPGIWDTTVGASPWRLTVMEQGHLLISDWGDKQGGIYLFNPYEPAVRNNFFAGTCNSASGEWTYNGKVIGGSTSGMAIRGRGQDATLISFQEDWPSDYSLNLVEYPIGGVDQINFAPTQPANYKTLSGYLINGNVDVVLAGQGMALGQVRGSGNNTKPVPVFLIADPEGNLLYNSGESYTDLDGGVGCIAFSNDGNQFYVQDGSGCIRVCALTWEPEFTLTELYRFDVLTGADTDYNSYQAAVDPAGNLYVANRSSMRVFSLPRQASDVTTPAPADWLVNGTAASVESILTGADTDAPVRYYNLQGIEMTSGNLPAGIYIRRQGTTAQKVVIR